MFEDLTFQAAFRRLFIYNILFEDAEVDGRYFQLDERSRVLGISAAGCGLASMLRFNPTSLDAVDINAHHLSLAGLRIAASQHLKDFDTFYSLFGLGKVANPKAVLAPLVEKLPPSMARYWARHYDRFSKGLYASGLTALMLRWLRKRISIGSAWMHDFVQKSEEDRILSVRRLLDPAFQQPFVRYLLNSPLQQLVLGVNFTQRARMGEDGQEMVRFFLSHCEKVARTDCRTNWFAWYAIAGHYNHLEANAVPPYLRRTEHAKSVEAQTKTTYHHRSIHDVLSEAKINTWTHYSLCDAVDWMQEREQRQLFSHIHRTARPGAMVLMRSVSRHNALEQLGLIGSHFIHLPEISAQATREERSCQYQRVDLFRVTA